MIFCIKNDRFCIQNDGFCIQNGDFIANIKTAASTLDCQAQAVLIDWTSVCGGIPTEDGTCLTPYGSGGANDIGEDGMATDTTVRFNIKLMIFPFKMSVLC